MIKAEQLPELHDALYENISNWLKSEVGVDLGDSRKTLVSGRLAKVLTTFKISNIQDLMDIVKDGSNEKLTQVVIDTLTTHETYFFRESEHLDYVTQLVLPKAKPGFKMWSAASSTGEEAFTLSLLCANYFSSLNHWSILGTDISSGVIDHANRGIFSNTRLKLVPPDLLKKFFKKGINQQEGYSLIIKTLKERVDFKVDNLMKPKTEGPFDVIFCRNVLIYFDNPTKQKVVSNLIARLKPGGILISGRCEPIRQFAHDVKVINHSILKRIE